MDSNFQLDHLVQINQLQREFSNQEFISVVQQLLRDLQLNTTLDLIQLYHQIEKKSGKVIGKDILKLLHVLKEENNVDKQLDIQLRFYLATISQLQSKGKNILTIGEFFVSFVLNNPKKGIVTSEIQQKISTYKVISLQKLLSVIQCIQKTRQESKILKSNKNIEKEPNKFDEQSTFEQTIQWSYLSSLKVILLEHVVDSKQLQRAMNLINKIKEELDDKIEHDQKVNEIQRKHEQKYSKLAEQLYKFEQALQEKDYIINKLQQQNMRYQQQIQMFEQKCQQDFIDAITNMSSQNQKLLGQKNEAITYIKQLQEQLSGFKHIYSDKMVQLEEEQEQNMKQIYSDLSLEVEEQMRRDSPQVVLKNQLKQAYNKILKLRKENQQLKNQISDLRAQLQSKAHVSGRQTDRTFKNLVLDQNPFCQQARDTFLDIIRKGSYADILNQEELQNLSYNNHSSKKLVRSITKEHLIDSMDMNQDQTLQERIFKMDSFDFIEVQNQIFLKDLASFIKTTSISLNKFKPIFSTSVQIVSYNGKKDKLALIHSSDKILLCILPSFNIKYTFPISDIEQIVIPEEPRNYIVIMVKQKNKKVPQLVISMNRRKQYLKYILKVGILELGQSQVKIIFQKEEKIVLNTNNGMISLSKFRDANNLVWRSVYDGEKVFEGKIKQVRFLSKQISCLIVITSIGILALTGKKQQWEDNKQVTILPYNKNMQIIDLSKEKKLKLVYPSIQKSYILEFLSYAETKLSKTLIDLQRQKIVNDFKQESQKYLSICAGFNKLGSIQQQYSDISE